MVGAADEAARARALATLRQLGGSAPPLVIEDAPRYAWRGVMLDVARHFFGVDDVLRFIDLAALYKLNVLHLHLTDDQGWRLQIDAWPELTVAGAATQVGGGAGGFYTHADYARIVAHATTQGITVVPEIDVPGHVNAALVAYPELGGGERPEPYTTWSSPGISLDVGSEIALRFVGDVISELVAVTPGEHIHLGGDEVEGMDHDAYAQFMWDACSLVLRHGKTPVVWEEAGVAKLPAGTLVQHWSDAAPDAQGGRAGSADPDVPGAARLPRPEVRRDDRARADLGGRRRGPRRLRVGPVGGARGRRGRRRRRPRCGRRRPRPAPTSTSSSSRACRRSPRSAGPHATTGRTSARGWPPTARSCRSSA